MGMNLSVTGTPDRSGGPAPAPLPRGQRPLRVMHLIQTLGRGGAERNLVNVLLRLPRGEHAVCYLHPPNDYAADLRRAGIPVRCLGLRGPFSAPGVLADLCLELLRGDYQLLCTQIWLSDLLGRLVGVMSRVPVISIVQTSAYEPETLLHFSAKGRLKMRLLQCLDLLTARLALRRLVAVSQFVGTQTMRRLHIPPERVLVIPNSVDLERFAPPAPGERERDRAQLGLGTEDRVLLSVGKVNRGKGNDLLIAAMPAVLRKAPRVRLLLLGTGPEVPRLESYAQELGVRQAVHFLGRQQDVRRYLCLADLFVFSSHYEGLPLAVLEAMSCGLPCLLSDIPPHREIADAGRSALLVTADPDAWARGILHLLGEPELGRRLSEHAHRRCQELYDAGVVAAALQGLFQAEARSSGHFRSFR